PVRDGRGGCLRGGEIARTTKSGSGVGLRMLHAFGAPAADGDAGPLRRKQARRLEADAGRRARDETDAVFEAQLHRALAYRGLSRRLSGALRASRRGDQRTSRRAAGWSRPGLPPALAAP